MNHGLGANHLVSIMIGLILCRPRSRFSFGVQILDSVALPSATSSGSFENPLPIITINSFV